jgi:hypothetical protein
MRLSPDAEDWVGVLAVGFLEASRRREAVLLVDGSIRGGLHQPEGVAAVRVDLRGLRAPEVRSTGHR